MKEIGGYIELEYYYGKEFHNGYKFDSVRSALSVIINERHYQHIYIPYYICSCISELLDAKEIQYSYYHIDKNFKPIMAREVDKESECILLVNYFGQLTDDFIVETARSNNIFLDNTQAFFNKPISGIDMANSCRKFLGVTGGGYLYTDLDINMELFSYDHSYDKLKCLVGRLEHNASDYYKYFIENEEKMRGYHCQRMSKFDENLLKSISYEKIISRRKNNFIYLSASLKEINTLEINNKAGLFMYPLLLDDDKGKKIKRYLIERQIYVPTLWPGISELNEINSFERDLVDNLILLPIDQRYGVEDMQYVLDVLDRAFQLI